MSVTQPCSIDGHRANVFARALAKLNGGATEAEIKEYFGQKGLKGKYIVDSVSKKIVISISHGHSPWNILQQLVKEPSKRARVTEVIVTNHNKGVVESWVKEGLGDVINIDGLRVFEKNAHFLESSTTWDFNGAHEDLALIASGKGKDRSNLYVSRNTWRTRGLTAALHEVTELAPANLREVYAKAARETVRYMEGGRTDKRLQNLDSPEAPTWVADNFLQDAKKNAATTKKLESYINTQIKKDQNITGKKLRELLANAETGEGYRALADLAPSTLPNATRNPKALSENMLVLNTETGHLGLQVARELLLSGLESKFPKTLDSLKYLVNKLNATKEPLTGGLKKGLTAPELLKVVLRSPEALTQVRTWETSKGPMWKMTEKTLLAETPTAGRKVVRDILGEKIEPPKVFEPEPIIDPTVDAVESIDAYENPEEVFMPEALPEEAYLDLPPEHTIVFEEITGSGNSMEYTSEPIPKEYWEPEGEAMDLEEVKHFLDLSTELKDRPELKDTLLRIQTMSDEAIISEILPNLRTMSNADVKVIAGFLNIRKDGGLMTRENIDKTLKHIGC